MASKKKVAKKKVSLLDRISLAQKELEAAKRKCERDGEKFFKEAVKEIFKEFPNVKNFSWVQYTPHWNDGDEWVGLGGTFYSLNCDYRLIIDNLMDLTHETYVHAGSIGDDAITRSPFEVTHTDRQVTVERWMEGIEPPPFWARLLGKPGHVDRWQIIRFEAPSVVAGDVGVALAGTGARTGDRAQGVNGFFLAAITPETATSCHYFWNFVRNFRTDDAELTKALTRAHVNDGKGVYDQDHDVLEAQQRAIDRQPRQPFYNLNIDAGAL